MNALAFFTGAITYCLNRDAGAQMETDLNIADGEVRITILLITPDGERHIVELTPRGSTAAERRALRHQDQRLIRAGIACEVHRFSEARVQMLPGKAMQDLMHQTPCELFDAWRVDEVFCEDAARVQRFYRAPEPPERLEPEPQETPWTPEPEASWRETSSWTQDGAFSESRLWKIRSERAKHYGQQGGGLQHCMSGTPLQSLMLFRGD